MKVLKVVCPVEACKAEKGQYCKLVDMANNPFVGRYHMARVKEAGKTEGDVLK